MERPSYLPAAGCCTCIEFREENCPGVPSGVGVGTVGESLAGSLGRGQAPPLLPGRATTLSRHVRNAVTGILFTELNAPPQPKAESVTKPLRNEVPVTAFPCGLPWEGSSPSPTSRAGHPLTNHPNEPLAPMKAVRH
jgi:hypothetical protein